jgi:predicted transcriptional regulator
MKQRITMAFRIKRYLIGRHHNRGVPIMTTISEIAYDLHTSKSTVGNVLRGLENNPEWKVRRTPHDAKSGQSVRFIITPPKETA